MAKSIQFKGTNENYYVHPYFPVGSIYLSVVNTNPSTWFGGTWSLIAQGRTLVGVDTSQTEFNTVKKTGGEKTHKLTIDEMPYHGHDIAYGPDSNGYGPFGSYVLTEATDSTKGKGWNGNIETFPTGGGQAHNNLQPYYTCYIWCRTA